MDGGTLLQARTIVLVPAGVKLATVRVDFELLAADLMVDLKLAPAKL